MTDVPVFGSRIAGYPYIERPSAYAVVRSANGCFLLIRTPRGFYLPGGGIEASETPEQAIEREAMEEAGLMVESRALIGKAIEILYSPEENAGYEKRCVFFEAEVVGQIPSHEGDHELIWVDFDRAIRMLSHESQRWALRATHNLAPLSKVRIQRPSSRVDGSRQIHAIHVFCASPHFLLIL